MTSLANLIVFHFIRGNPWDFAISGMFPKDHPMSSSEYPLLRIATPYSTSRASDVRGLNWASCMPRPGAQVPR